MKMPNAEHQLINHRLADTFGNTADMPNFRLVWSDDERERRGTLYTEEGFQLLYPEVREMRKYPDIRERYVLESLIENYDPDQIEDGKPVAVLIYQPIWTFEIFDNQRNRIGVIPSYAACRFIIEIVLNNIAQAGNYVKYKETGLSEEEQREKIDKLQQELFGNESTITDALSLRQGVAYGAGSQPNSGVNND